MSYKALQYNDGLRPTHIKKYIVIATETPRMPLLLQEVTAIMIWCISFSCF